MIIQRMGIFKRPMNLKLAEMDACIQDHIATMTDASSCEFWKPSAM